MLEIIIVAYIGLIVLGLFAEEYKTQIIEFISKKIEED